MGKNVHVILETFAVKSVIEISAKCLALMCLMIMSLPGFLGYRPWDAGEHTQHLFGGILGVSRRGRRGSWTVMQLQWRPHLAISEVLKRLFRTVGICGDGTEFWWFMSSHSLGPGGLCCHLSYNLAVMPMYQKILQKCFYRPTCFPPSFLF